MSRILLAEGHGPTRELIEQGLAEARHEVVVAAEPGGVADLFLSARPQAVVLAADYPDVEALARRLREADPLLLLLVVDKGHLGQARGIQSVLHLRANAYVADPTGQELGQKLELLLDQAAGARARLHGVPLLLSRTPDAEGEVTVGVVARVLHQIWRSISEGVLVLEGSGPERRYFFLRGVPVAFESSDPAEALPAWFAQAGLLDEGGRRAAEEAMAGGLSPGASLVAAGVVEPGEPLQAARRNHLEAMVARSVGARQGRWRFHAGDDFVGQVQATEVLPLRPLLAGARAHIPTKHFADALKAVLDAFPARTGDWAQLVPGLGLSTSDQRLAQGIDGRTSTRAFLSPRKSDLGDALSLLWFLSLIGAMAFREEGEPAVDAPAPTTAPRARPSLPIERAEALRQAALRILPGTYFHALGVDIAADAVEIERAHKAVAARFNPEGFSEYEVGDLGDLLRTVQDKVDAAHRVLSDEGKRRDYLGFLLLKFELSGVRRPGISVDAEVAFKKGERALRSRRLVDAVQALRRAAELNPREPEYLAMLAFAELHHPAFPAEARAEEARAVAQRALALEPAHLRGRVVLALAEHLAGHAEAAREAALTALRAHPFSDLAKRVLARIGRR